MAVKREKERREIKYASAKDRAEKHEREFEPTALNIPEGCKLFRFKKAGVYRLDILPYLVNKGAETPGGNPYVDEGFYAYERTYYTHRIPTPEGERPYCCLAKNFKKKCPMCEWLNQQARRGMTWDDRKQMDCKEFQLFNVIDLDDPKAGIQVFAFNWFEFGKIIDAKAKSKERYREFYSLKGGYTLEVTVEENDFKGRTRLKPINYEFEKRDDYDNDILEKVFDLDTMPKELTYEEFSKIVNEGESSGEASSNGKAPAKSSAKSKAKSKEEDDDEDEDEDEDQEDEDDNDEDEEEDTADDGRKFKDVERIHPKKGEFKGKVKEMTAKECGISVGDFVTHPRLGECKVLKISPDGTSLTVEDEDKDVESGVAPEDCKLVPVKGKTPAKPTKGKKVDPDEDEEEDDDSDDDDSDEGEDDDDDFEEDEEDEPEPVKKAGRKVGGKAKGNKGGK